MQFFAILDSRTTDICESRHGRMMRLDSPELAANTPPLHYQCRSMLSPITMFDLRDMEKPGWKDEDGKSFEQLLDWGKVEKPSKGFGELGKVMEGKLSKGKENNNMWFKVPDEEIKQTAKKFDALREKHPDLIKEVTEDSLRKASEYLANADLGKVEKDVWDRIAEGDIYSYACHVHEKTEIAKRIGNTPYKVYHGEALLQQYDFLSNYVEQKIGQKYDVILLCCADSWEEDYGGGLQKDYYNAAKLRDYLKIREPRWYNEGEGVPTFKESTNVPPDLRALMNTIRQKGSLP